MATQGGLSKLAQNREILSVCVCVCASARMCFNEMMGINVPSPIDTTFLKHTYSANIEENLSGIYKR